MGPRIQHKHMSTREMLDKKMSPLTIRKFMMLLIERNSINA